MSTAYVEKAMVGLALTAIPAPRVSRVSNYNGQHLTWSSRGIRVRQVKAKGSRADQKKRDVGFRPCAPPTGGHGVSSRPSLQGKDVQPIP